MSDCSLYILPMRGHSWWTSWYCFSHDWPI